MSIVSCVEERMRVRYLPSFGLVAVLILAACTKPEPQPVASVEEPQPAPQTAPEPAAQATITATPDDPTALLRNCKLEEPLYSNIRFAKARLDETLKQL